MQAFENGGHQQAPKDGTIGKVRIVSCVGGSFTVQVARARPGPRQARIVRSGPKLTYVKDTQSGGCGGLNGDNYQIQSFNVNLKVSQGDYIAVKGTKIGFIHNSSSGDAMRVRAPAADGRLIQDGRHRHRQPAHPVPVQVAHPNGGRGDVLPAARPRTGYHPRAVLGGELAVPCTCNPLQQG